MQLQLFAVHESGDCDCVFPGYVSVWKDYSDAEAAAGELQAMDPEAFYSVHTIEEPDFADFWWHNPHLEFQHLYA